MFPATIGDYGRNTGCTVGENARSEAKALPANARIPIAGFGFKNVKFSLIFARDTGDSNLPGCRLFSE